MNDNNIKDGNAPSDFYTATKDKGKFFTRGCRGMLEQLKIYCRRTGTGTLKLRYSPHPCLGPYNQVGGIGVRELTITPGATWAWVSGNVEQIWNYDSLFVWVYECDADVSWAYDVVQPYDSHALFEMGTLWVDLGIRPFIRAVYTGETPGDVPVSGVVNNIRIPNTSSGQIWATNVAVPADTETTLAVFEGAGTCNLIIVTVAASADSDDTRIEVFCDGRFIHDHLGLAFMAEFSEMNAYGITASTPGVSLTKYTADGFCCAVITREIDFRRELRIAGYHATKAVTMSTWAYANILK